MMRVSDEQPDRDPDQAKRFFQYAQQVTDAGNYDYAIICWINGLQHAPADLQAHRELLQVARLRKRTGGKPVRNSDLRNAPAGRGVLNDMLTAEFYWAHDPDNIAMAKCVLECARTAEMYEVASWVAKCLSHRTNRPQ